MLLSLSLTNAIWWRENKLKFNCNKIKEMFDALLSIEIHAWCSPIGTGLSRSQTGQDPWEVLVCLFFLTVPRFWNAPSSRAQTGNIHHPVAWINRFILL